MATKTLTFTHKVNGTLTNATSVYLSDPTATFGVKRNDTDGVVVADNTAMTNASTGVYTYSFTEPVAGLTYTYYVEWTYAGITNRAEFTATGATSVTDIDGYYADGGDIEDIFGTDNVRKWSQLDNTVATADTVRIASALAYADREIDNFFRGSPYTVPMTPVDATMTYWAAVLAGVWLYRNRGQQDSAETDDYSRRESDVRNDMAQYRGGLKRLTAAKAHSEMPTVPVVVM